MWRAHRGECGAEDAQQRAQADEALWRQHRQQPHQQLLGHGRRRRSRLRQAGRPGQWEGGCLDGLPCAARLPSLGRAIAQHRDAPHAPPQSQRPAATPARTSTSWPCMCSLKASRPCTSATPDGTEQIAKGNLLSKRTPSASRPGADGGGGSCLLAAAGRAMPGARALMPSSLDGVVQGAARARSGGPGALTSAQHRGGGLLARPLPLQKLFL